MARAKKNNAPRFLVRREDSADKKMMSCRIDTALYDEFQRASKTAVQHGWDLSFTRVVERAMQDAIDEVHEQVGESSLLDLMEADQDSAPADEQDDPKPARRSRRKPAEQADTPDTE